MEDIRGLMEKRLAFNKTAMGFSTLEEANTIPLERLVEIAGEMPALIATNPTVYGAPEQPMLAQLAVYAEIYATNELRTNLASKVYLCAFNHILAYAQQWDETWWTKAMIDFTD